MTSSPQDGFRRIKAVTGVLVAAGVIGAAAGSLMAYSDTQVSQAGGAPPPAQVTAPATDPSAAGTGGGSGSVSSGSSLAGASAPGSSGSRFGVAPQLVSGSGSYHAQSSGS